AHSVQLKNYATSLGLTTDLANFTDLVNFYIWIKIVDSVGNFEEYPYLVCIDPQGDRPTITLSNPENAGESLGGTVKLYGTAEDSNGTVESVWVQLLSAKNGSGYGPVSVLNNTITSFVPTSRDLDFWKTKGYTVEKMKPNASGVHEAWTGTTDSPGSLADEVSAAEYGIKANFSGTSWNLKINRYGEFDPAENVNTANNMAIRVYACDNEKNLSYSLTRYFKMDKDTPVISNVLLKQYNNTGTVTASQEVRSGMYVKGNWYLEFTATDNVELGSIVLVDSNGVESSIDSSAITQTDVKTWQVKYSLDTGSGVGNYFRTIKASDTTSHDGTYEVNINYDNEAPKLLVDTSSEFNIAPEVRQSNGFYKLYSKVSDASTTGTPSGVNAIGFYFMRRKSTNEGHVYDPMQKRADPISTNDLTYADGLYWLEGAVTCDDSGKITLGTELTAKKNYIHAGSYIRLNGVMYKIESISGTDGNEITIAESHESVTSAQIALALFVDNKKSEYEVGTAKNDNGYYTTVKNDDGDSMIEELGGTSSLATWQGSIVSSNIPDGPIEVHYTAYDAAQNYAVGLVGNQDLTTYRTYTTAEVSEVSGSPSLNGTYASFVYSYNSDSPAFVSNNAPRIAGVIVATDTNANGVIDESESYTEWVSSWNSTAFGYSTWNDAKTSLTIPSTSTTASPVSIFTTKGLTKIKPEIIGGNGVLKYNYTVAKRNTADTDWANPYYTKTSLTQIADQTADAQYQALATITPIKFTVQDYLTAGTTGSEIVDADNQKFSFTIWDSTDGTTCGTDSQKASLDLIMSVKLRDQTPPQAAIKPFFWTSLNENSIYGSDAVDENNDYVVESVGDLAGHIELENATNTKPDISGKVVIRGTASDTRMIKKLY
ncbi:MAG: hypothetical protein K6C97_10655, partial [Treponema sp.]|nr:hypothetical protein [Treponema sp.]